MAAASDKARFFLEQSIPELQEYERKKIFSTDEIVSITKKRSEFEHKLNARGAQVSDFARYAEFEMNLESLRRKRVKRLGIKSSNHSGQRRVFFVLDRATRKFCGDLGLWMQYIEYARKEKATKKLLQIFTSVLRLHPTKPELWIYAARYATDGADMTAARSYMQRGLRFCKTSKTLWIEYAKLEMSYVAKIAARQQILGLDGSRRDSREVATETDTDESIIKLPELTAEDMDPSLKVDDSSGQNLWQNLSSTPALSGAIPLAIFDAAVAQFANDKSIAEGFFNLFANFEGIPCVSNILQHVIDHMLDTAPTAPSSLSSYSRQPIMGVDALSAAFPGALRVCLERVATSTEKAEAKAELFMNIFGWWCPLLQIEGLDAGIRKVLAAKSKKMVLESEKAADREGKLTEHYSAKLVEVLRQAGLHEDAQRLQTRRLQV